METVRNIQLTLFWRLHHSGWIKVCVNPSSRKSIKFFWMHSHYSCVSKNPLSLQVTYKEIDEMIKTVDKNGDGKINYSEFRVRNPADWHQAIIYISLQVMMGAPPLLIPATTLSKFARSATALTNLTNAALFSGHTAQPSSPPPDTREKYWEAFSESRIGFLPIMQWLLFTFV